MQVTKTDIKEYLKLQLSTNQTWSLTALLIVLNNQTEYEQVVEDTVNRNSIGFNEADGRILTSIAKQYKDSNFITPSQLTVVLNRMPKYWKQILAVSDLNKLKVQTAFNQLYAAA
jgi:hypothetical protein